MSLTCSRCETEVPAESLYCPYCSLPKPKGGFVQEDPEEESRHAEPRQSSAKLKSSNLKSSNLKSGKKEQKRSSSRAVRTPRPTSNRRSFKIPIAAAIIGLLGVGIYTFVVPLVYSDQAEPKVVLAALDTLRKMPSNEPGVTIDARLTRDLETARRVKNLVSYKGWTVQKIKGTRTKVLMVYSYQEVGDVHKRAEWLADLTTNTFTPQTDMAVAVSSK